MTNIFQAIENHTLQESYAQQSLRGQPPFQTHHQIISTLDSGGENLGLFSHTHELKNGHIIPISKNLIHGIVVNLLQL